MGFGDIFAGWEGQAANHYQNLLKMEYDSKKELASQYAKLADDPRYDEDSKAEFQKRALNILMLEPGKKLPKEYENFTIKVKPPLAPNVDQGIQMPQTGPLAQAMSGSKMEAPTIAPPRAPEEGFDQNMLQPMSYDKQMERLRQHTEATQKWTAPQKVSGGTTNIDGQNVGWTRWRYPDGTERTEIDPYDKSFAPRMANATALDSQDLAALNANNIPNPIPKGQLTPELLNKLNTVLPGSDVVIDASSGNYYIRSAKYRIGSISGQQVATQETPPSGAPMTGAQVVGQTTSTLPKTQVSPQVRGVDEGGKVAVFPAERTTTTAIPSIPGVSSAPTAPVQPPAATAPQATPQQPVKPQAQQFYEPPAGQPKVITEDVINTILQANKSNPAVTREVAIQALKNSGWSEQGGATQQPVSMSAPAPAPPPTAPQAPPAAGGKYPAGYNAALFNKEQDIMRAVRPAVQILIGDPNNPLFESLEQFAPIADDPEARIRVGAAFKVIVHGLADVDKVDGPDAALKVLGVGISGGSTSDIVKNFLGVPTLAARASANAIEQALAPLSDREKRMVARSIAGYATVVGFRRLTAQSGYKFSTDLMERELPMPGLNVNDSKSYYNKIAQLIEEPKATVSRMFTIDPKEKEFFETSAKRLTVKGLATRAVRNPQTNSTAYLVNGRWIDEQGNPIR